MSARELAAEGASDRSVFSLIAANVLAIAIAVWLEMSLRELMLTYWTQSAIIGVSFLVRILSLEAFAIRGWTYLILKESERQFGRVRAALVFLLPYAFFHSIFFIALVSESAPLGRPVVLGAGFWFCVLAFACHHAYSLWHNITRDRLGKPNLGTFMFLPYARILPMHLTLVLSGVFVSGTATLVLFTVLKTISDVVMHTVEHHVLRKGRTLLA